MIYSHYKIEDGKTAICICVFIGILKRKLKLFLKASSSKHMKYFYCGGAYSIAKNYWKCCFIVCFNFFRLQIFVYIKLATLKLFQNSGS